MDLRQRKNIFGGGLGLDTPVRGHRTPASHREFAQSSPRQQRWQGWNILTWKESWSVKIQRNQRFKETKQCWRGHVKAPGSEVWATWPQMCAGSWESCTRPGLVCRSVDLAVQIFKSTLTAWLCNYTFIIVKMFCFAGSWIFSLSHQRSLELLSPLANSSLSCQRHVWDL